MSIDGLPEPIPAPDMDRREYAALPVAQAGRLRKAWRAMVGERATTPNGAPFPLRSWPPDAAVDIQALAEWIDSRIVPTGALTPYAGAAAPTGWLMAQGQAVSRTTYAALFTVCGTAYGAGDGTTTFNIPNLKGKVAAGADSGQAEFTPLGKNAGAKTHTLTTAEMPSHAHDYLYGGNPIVPNGTLALTGAGNMQFAIGNAAGGPVFIGATGGTQPHNNLQPYVVTGFIIKT